jgi:hypothetical protein
MRRSVEKPHLRLEDIQEDTRGLQAAANYQVGKKYFKFLTGREVLAWIWEYQSSSRPWTPG